MAVASEEIKHHFEYVHVYIIIGSYTISSPQLYNSLCSVGAVFIIIRTTYTYGIIQ